MCCDCGRNTALRQPYFVTAYIRRSGGGSTQPSTTTFVGSYEEVNVAAGVTMTTKYYNAGVTTVLSVNGGLSYLASDGLGSVAI